MRKNIEVYIKNNDKKKISNYKAIYLKDKQVLKYQEDDKTNVTLNLKDNILIRENNEIYMKYIFIKNNITESNILIKDLDKNINIKIKTNKILKQDKIYELEYEIIESNEKFIYKVKMED